MMKVKKGESGGIKTFLFGVIFSIGIVFLISFIFALAASFSNNPTAKVGGYSLFSLILSAFISGIYISKSRGEWGARASFLTALTVALIMAVSGIIGSGGMPLSLLMNCISYLGVCMLSALLLGKKKRKYHKRRH